MWTREPGAPYNEPDDYTLRRRRLSRLRLAAWVLIGSGGVLFVNEIGIWWSLLGLMALALAAATGVYVLVQSWSVWPQRRWLGLLPLAATGLFLVGDPIAHLASAWVLIGLGLTLLARTR